MAFAANVVRVIARYSSPDRPVVVQATRVTAVRGRTVTLGDPLLHDVRAEQPAVLAEWRHLTNVGIQNLRFQFPDAPAFGHHLEQGYNGIYMTGVFDGWVRNLVIDQSDSDVTVHYQSAAGRAKVSGDRAIYKLGTA